MIVIYKIVIEQYQQDSIESNYTGLNSTNNEVGIPK